MSAETSSTLAAMLSTFSAICILVAGYFTQIGVGFGGSKTYLRPWVKYGLYPVMITVQLAAVALLVCALK